MEINNQICSQQSSCIEDSEKSHLSNILNNIEVWEKYQYHPQIVQKKLTQTTAILQNESLQSFSLNIKVPSTYFAGVEENYSVRFSLDSPSNNHEKSIMDEDNSIKLDLNYHRMHSIYDMSNVVEFVFNFLKHKLVKTDVESLEVLTSLIIFEMENASKHRNPHVEISQEMFSLDNPHIKWTSNIHVKAIFSDYSSTHLTKYYH